MPPDTSIAVVVTLVISHTPHWVWTFLALLTVLGLAQLKETTVSPMRVGSVALGMAGYSLWGTLGAFGSSITVLAAWMFGMALAVLANLWIGWPGAIKPADDGRFVLGGSVVPLLAIWAIFAVRYATTVTLVFHPDWARGTLLGIAMPLVYGVLSGVFAARALRIVRFSPVGPVPTLA